VVAAWFGSVWLKQADDALFKNPEVTVEIVSNLYYEPLRAQHLVTKVAKSVSVSEPTVYAVLKELTDAGIIEKYSWSRRHVAYTLTAKGRTIAEKEHLDAVNDMLRLIESEARRRELLVELLLDELLRDAPEEVRSSTEARAALRRSIVGEVTELKKRLTARPQPSA
jgi:DNA-binding PadR family transcriptional regulator